MRKEIKTNRSDYSERLSGGSLLSAMKSSLSQRGSPVALPLSQTGGSHMELRAVSLETLAKLF